MVNNNNNFLWWFYEKKNRIPPSESQEGTRSFLLFDVFLQFDIRLNVVAHLETLLKGLHLLLFHASHVDEIGILDESWILSSIAATRARGIGQPAFVPRMVDNGWLSSPLYVLFQTLASDHARSKYLSLITRNDALFIIIFFNRCRHIV